MLLTLIYIKACVQNKAQLCVSSACISGCVLSDKEQTQTIYKQLCWINLGPVVAGLMKSKVTESQHIDICKPINLLNKKWGDKNPPQTTQLNKKSKKEEIGNTVNNNNPQAGERGKGGKDFARDLTELMTRKRRKNPGGGGGGGRITGKIPQYTY